MIILVINQDSLAIEYVTKCSGFADIPQIALFELKEVRNLSLGHLGALGAVGRAPVVNELTRARAHV